MMNIVLSLTFCLFIIVVATGSTDLAAAPNIQRIIGGNEAARYQFPYMVSLYIHPSNGFCGGSLITDRTILTAAHCIKQDVASEIGRASYLQV
ncbi:hypothetical protein HA402_003857 [Bradysia odoriphaga]|nr:hypothetical protein HA402_003857 [Bradysia odoriphaga]